MLLQFPLLIGNEGLIFNSSGVTCVRLQIYAMCNTACVNVKDNFEMNDNFTVECSLKRHGKQKLRLPESPPHILVHGMESFVLFL